MWENGFHMVSCVITNAFIITESCWLHTHIISHVSTWNDAFEKLIIAQLTHNRPSLLDTGAIVQCSHQITSVRFNQASRTITERSHSTAHCDCLRAACRSDSQQIDGRFCLQNWGSTQSLHHQLPGALAHAVERMKVDAEPSSIYL